MGPLTIGTISVSGLLLLLVPLFLRHLLVKDRIKQQEHSEAKRKLRETFTSQLQYIRQEGNIDVYLSLFNAFSEHQKAINEFRRFLKGRKLKQFDDVWKQYYANPGGKKLKQYEAKPNHEESEQRRKLAVDKIEAILSFAK